MKKRSKTSFIVRILSGVFLTTSGLLTSFSLLAQPTVQVPPGCEVVVAGSGPGVSTGFGKIVGNGGIIIMPDEYSGDIFTILPGGATVTSWRLSGDLSIQQPPLTGLPAYPSAQQNVPVTSLSANIMSFNKNVRSSEYTSVGSSPNLARSKGRMTLTYDHIPCGGNISFDVYKRYDNSVYIPPIIGPNCWLPDSIYTYSVDQIASDNLADGIGIDEYYWTVFNGSTYISNFYHSADKSSITLTAPNPVDGPWTITCCFGRANSWDGNAPSTPHTTCVTKVIGGQPTQPLVTTSSCVPIDPSVTSFNASVNSPILGYTYEWSSTNSTWTLTAGGTAGETLTVTNLGEGPGTIILKVKNGDCSSAEFQYPVKRSFQDPHVTIKGDICLDTGNTYTYHIDPSGAQFNETQWNLPSVPSPWTYTANGTGSVINLTVPAGTPAGSYILEAFSCVNSPADIIQLEVKVRPPSPHIISGQECIDFGSTAPLVYTVDPTGNYEWEIPTGWTGSSTSETITLIPDGIHSGQIKATGTVNNGCNSSASAIWNTSFKPISPDSIIYDCWNFGYDATNTIRIHNAPNPFFGTYLVTDPSGTFLDGYSVASNGDILLQTSGNTPQGSYSLVITHQTSNPVCNISTPLTYSVYFTGNGTIVTPYPGGASDVYIVSGEPLGSTYKWHKDGNLIPGAATSFLGLTGPSPGPAEVCAHVTYNGCTTAYCVPGGNHSRPGSNGNRSSTETIKVFPNPNNGAFMIDIPSHKQSAYVQVIDIQGRLIDELDLKEGTNAINQKDLTGGVYFLLVRVDGILSVHKIDISK